MRRSFRSTLFRIHCKTFGFAGLACAVTCVLSLGSIGCKRGFYLRTADRDAYGLINEKGAGPTWALQPGFNVEPDSRSRFHDPTCDTDPTLPIPAPQLYSYDVPLLATAAPAPRDLNRTASQAELEEAEQVLEPDELQDAESPSDRDVDDTQREDVTTSDAEQSTSLASYLEAGPLETDDNQDVSPAIDALTPTKPARLPLVPSAGTGTDDENNTAEDEKADESQSPLSLVEPLGQTPLPRLAPVPQDAWLSLPETCLKRMLEFETVRAEYERSFKQPVDESQLDAADRVNLENILEIALINSREYQTRKETLYRTALRLSLQRFDYDLKFLSRGNGTSLAYTHDRRGGIENNRLGISTGTGITRSLYSGGNFVARFANEVVLTFNGPAGASSSVGSQITAELFQPILQRDVNFEALTQAERDVVYAARDFVRFRKTLFSDLAGRYYSLLLTYRSIAINTQDYLSNLREFNRAAATERAGRIPLFQVDQIEQQVLGSRGNLINSCNALEGAIDNLKIRIGLPTELPLNLALSELEDISARDEASVLREQLSRKSRVFLQQQDREGTSVAIPALTEVARRLLSLAEVNERIGEADNTQIKEMQVLVTLLEAEEKRIEARKNEMLLEKNSLANDDEAQVLPAQLFIRSKEVVQLTLEAVRQEILLLQQVTEQSDEASKDSPAKSKIDEFAESWIKEVEAFKNLDEKLEGVPFAEQAAQLPLLISVAQDRLASAKKLEDQIQRSLEDSGITMAKTEADLERLVDAVLTIRDQIPGGTGLAALDVDMDEAMLTALVQRLDLMNQRGQLADSWRQIKYAGDDLRSILNLRASQAIRTRAGSNNPLDFSFKDSTTQLSMDFDTPLNRRSERNDYRFALINYNVSLRQLIEAQDLVKLGIRNDLRAIELDRNQYDIAIASAALAYDRVTSTRMQVALGQGNVSARDFLEAQQAYTRSLSSVAQQHINYIGDRIQFFLDLEQLQVDQVNFWPDLRNESYPFMPDMDFENASPDGYGTLPCGPWYSRCIRRMEQVPPGQAMNHKPMTLPPTKAVSSE